MEELLLEIQLTAEQHAAYLAGKLGFKFLPPAPPVDLATEEKPPVDPATEEKPPVDPATVEKPPVE